VVDDYSPCADENIRNLEKQDIQFEYWTIDQQKNFFKKHFQSNYEKYWSVIPHKTDACRSFGYLVAWLWGADVIITFDDDNYPINNLKDNGNYIKCHDIVNSTFKGKEVNSSNGWFNTIDMLKTNPNRRLFARGYPYYRRSEETDYTYNSCSGEVVLNAGLWLENPDVDSISVLNEGSPNGLPNTRTVGFKNHNRLVLSKNTLGPLNTANTAYSSKLIPIMYDTYQGAYVGELKLDRFGDIWSNLFIQKVINKLNKRIAIGTPLVDHKREPRDTFDDFKKEFWGIIISEKLFRCLEDMDLHSTTYIDLYLELIQNLRNDFIKEIQQESIQGYLNKLLSSMEMWVEIVEKLN
tara:strand:- start:19 stop:1071 length:1053 start_codon:yes stop_codon:yes gene_type:complete